MNPDYNYTDIVSMIKEILDDPLSAQSEDLASQIVDTVINEVNPDLSIQGSESLDISPDL
jgi:hypothetical protein